MNNENNIDAVVVELDQIYETYQRHVSFNSKIDAVKKRHKEEDNAITAAARDKMKNYEKKRRVKNKVTRPVVDKAFWAPVPELPEIPTPPSGSSHMKSMMIGSASGLAILLGLVLCILFTDLAAFFGILLLGGLFAWFMLGGSKMVESYLKWQNEIKEYSNHMNEWELTYGKLDFNKNSDNLIADVAAYEKEFLSIVKDCDGVFDELFEEMLKEKNKLAQHHIVELERLEEEWKEICNRLQAVTLIHSDLFYIAWRISSALKKGRAVTLREAINIAINDERLAQEEAERQAEARRQEAILQSQAEDNRRHNEAVERAAREQARRTEEAARNAERAAREQARQAEEAARSRCIACINYHKCSYTIQKNSLSCSAFTPK